MKDALQDIKKLWHLLLERKITLRHRLMLFLFILIFIGLSLSVLIFAVMQGSFGTKQRISSVLENKLQISSNASTKEREEYAGFGIQLERQLSQALENMLDSKGLTISELNDNPEALMEAQKILYSEINTNIQRGRSSGVFAVLDATINTNIPEAKHSRCGVYLRLINVSSDVVVIPETILFRGSPELARENGLELHNRWNLEMDIKKLPGWQELSSNVESVNEAYLWCNRVKLPDTWEDVNILVLPLRGSGGEFYGICGIELNDLHFKLKYPASDTPFGSIVTLIAPFENGSLNADKGMLGDTGSSKLDKNDVLTLSKNNEDFNTYQAGDNTYYGKQKSFFQNGKQEWVTAVLVSQDACNRLIYRSYIYMALAALCFIGIMLIFALFLSKQFVRPILEDFKEIQEFNGDVKTHSKITELEELRQWMLSHRKAKSMNELPPDMRELLLLFAKNTKTLTASEYSIFKYYADGYKISQLPEVACLSMSTIKKHNGNIYRKLGISSYHELMMYLDLFRRCNCLDLLRQSE